MYENINYLPVEELDDNLIDYLKSSLNQSATLNKTTWEKVYTDLRVSVTMMKVRDCKEYFELYYEEILFYAWLADCKNFSSVSYIVKTGLLYALNIIAFDYGYYI